MVRLCPATVPGSAAGAPHPVRVTGGWWSRIARFRGNCVLRGLGDSPPVPQPREHTEWPVIQLLRVGDVSPPGPPGESKEERLKARVGVGEVAFDSAEGTQLTPAPVTGHDSMLALVAGRLPPPAGVIGASTTRHG